MKGLILSGGKGTRLRPFTFTSAKQLIPVANKPVLIRVIEAIRDAGITEIGIVVGDTAAEIKEAVGRGEQWGVSVTYIPQDAPRGLAHAVQISQDFLGDDRFVMFLGDNVIQGGISPLIREFASSAWNSQIVLTRIAHPEQYGVAELDEQGRIVRLVEKPKNRRVTWRWSASTCSTRTSTKRSTASSRAGAASSRSPTPSSGWSTTITPCIPTCTAAGGSTPGSRRHAGGQ
jgi:glucose-1-phosphate thymidylyltransferase